MKRLPIYSFIGLLIMAVSEGFMLAHIEPFWSWHTPIAWTGYVLFVDGLVRARRGSSWITHAPNEFVFLAVMSVPLWLVFEAYNLLIRNWHYVNLPMNLFWRTFGYTWSFATIWPAIFETAELVATIRGDSGNHHPGHRAGSRQQAAADQPGHASHAGTRPGLKAEVRSRRPMVTSVTSGVIPRSLSPVAWVSITAGALMLLWPIARPSPYLAAPVWLGFIFLLDPLNAGAGAEAIWNDWDLRGRDRLVNLAISGLVCGLIWEFWNYWARAKWIYSVPILSNLKMFEMPLPGYLGFPPFALECFTMYVAARRWMWRGAGRPIGL